MKTYNAEEERGGDRLIKRRHALVLALAFCLTATLFVVATIGYDPWIDLDDDGYIGPDDFALFARQYGASGEPINKTELLLDLQARVEALENQSVPSGYIGPPAYDSGWQSINQYQTLTLTHNLNTTEVFVYVIAKAPSSMAINQFYYGYAWLPSGENRGLSWYSLTDTSIRVLRAPDDTGTWSEVRVMMWKIQEPPA